MTKTKEHTGWQSIKLGGWVGLTYVALVLGYNLAFWRGVASALCEIGFLSCISTELENMWQTDNFFVTLEVYVLKNKGFSHTGRGVLFIYWTAVSTDKLTQAPGFLLFKIHGSFTDTSLSEGNTTALLRLQPQQQWLCSVQLLNNRRKNKNTKVFMSSPSSLFPPV